MTPLFLLLFFSCLRWHVISWTPVKRHFLVMCLGTKFESFDSEQNTYRHLKRNVSLFVAFFFLSLIFVVEDFSSSFTLNVLSLFPKKTAFTVHEKEISRCRTTGRTKSKKILSSSFLKQHSFFFLCHVVHHRQVSLSCHVICDHFISFRRMKKRTSSSSS